MMELNESQFIAGFNSGYILAEFEPQFLTTLLKCINSTNSYTSGLVLGQKEFELEQNIIKMDELSRLRKNSIDDRFKDRE